MAPPSGAASYKKKDGILTLTTDEQMLTWTPAAAGASALSIPVATITSTHSSFVSLVQSHRSELTRVTRFATDARFKPESHAKNIRFGRQRSPK